MDERALHDPIERRGTPTDDGGDMQCWQYRSPRPFALEGTEAIGRTHIYVKVKSTDGLAIHRGRFDEQGSWCDATDYDRHRRRRSELPRQRAHIRRTVDCWGDGSHALDMVGSGERCGACSVFWPWSTARAKTSYEGWLNVQWGGPSRRHWMSQCMAASICS